MVNFLWSFILILMSEVTILLLTYHEDEVISITKWHSPSSIFVSLLSFLSFVYLF